MVINKAWLCRGPHASLATAYRLGGTHDEFDAIPEVLKQQSARLYVTSQHVVVWGGRGGGETAHL